MKKILLMTSALVLASATTAAAADYTPAPVPEETTWDVSLGGKLDIGFVMEEIGDQDATTGITSDSALNISASTELNNGLTVTADIELVTDSSDSVTKNGDVVLTISSADMGSLLLGDAGSASDELTVGVPSHVDENAGSDGSALGMGLNEAVTEVSSGPRATYLSPSINGFQVGITYAVADVANDEWSDALEVGAQFSQDVSGVSVSVGGGYFSAGEKGDESTNDSISGYIVGIKASMDNVAVGGQYGSSTSEDDAATGTDVSEVEGTTMAVGASYSMDDITLGAAWFNGTETTTLANASETETEHTRMSGGISYSLGSGVTVGVEGAMDEYDDGDDATDNLEATTFGGFIKTSF